jgi:hypothetical protein
MTMMKLGLNNTRHVVWALGEFFVSSYFFDANYIMFYLYIGHISTKYTTAAAAMVGARDVTS